MRAAWSHYLTDPNPDVLAFAGGTIPVVLRDPDPGRDGAVVGLEVTGITGGFQVFAGYMPASSARTRPPTRAASACA